MNRPIPFRLIRGVVLSLCFLTFHAGAQETFPVNGVVDKDLVRTVFDHAVVHVASGEVMQDASVVVYQGRIESVVPTAMLELNGPAVREDLTGFHVYPIFCRCERELGHALSPRRTIPAGQSRCE